MTGIHFQATFNMPYQLPRGLIFPQCLKMLMPQVPTDLSLEQDQRLREDHPWGWEGTGWSHMGRERGGTAGHVPGVMLWAGHTCPYSYFPGAQTWVSGVKLLAFWRRCGAKGEATTGVKLPEAQSVRVPPGPQAQSTERSLLAPHGCSCWRHSTHHSCLSSFCSM